MQPCSAHRVIAENKGVDVKFERDRGVSELADTVVRVETAVAYLDHGLAEGANVGDDVNVPARVLAGPAVHVLNGLVHLVKVSL